jgi:ABC-type transport system involved in multi-copper enzyme maturation permease subunit
MMSTALGRSVAVARNTLREILRERVLHSLVFFVVLMGLCALLAQDLSIQQHGKLIKDFGLAAIEAVGTLIALFLGAGLLGRELERRSVYVLLSKPLTRSEFVLGKFAGLGAALFINVAAMTLVMYASLWVTSAQADLRLLVAVGPLYLGMLLVVSLALACSAITSQTMATLWTFALLVAGRYADVIRNMQQVTKVPRWLTLGLYYLLPNFRTFDLKDRVVYGDPLVAGDLAYIAAYALAYIVVLLSLAIAVFRRKDLP